MKRVRYGNGRSGRLPPADTARLCGGAQVNVRFNSQRKHPMKTTTLSHDAFARHSTVRQHASGECAWCGMPAKFRYGTELDGFGARPRMQTKVFCGKSCERAYNG